MKSFGDKKRWVSLYAWDTYTYVCGYSVKYPDLIVTLSFYSAIIIGNILKKGIALMGVIHPATIMLHSITYYQIVNFQYHIIAGYLIEYRLCDLDVRSFVFYDHSC